jgi:mannose-1-phosphate guanylyltransferase/phosphomannomutase
VRDSVVNGASVLENASVTGAVLCRDAVVGRGASVCEGAVIGEGGAVGAGTGRGLQKEAPPFTSRGEISGVFGAGITASSCLALGEASAALSGRVGLSHAGGDAARIAAEAIGSGVCAAGSELLRFDCGLPSCASYFGMSLSLPLTIFVKQDEDRLEILFFGQDGGALPHDTERKLLAPAGAPRPAASRPGRARDAGVVADFYAAAAARYAGQLKDAAPLEVIVPRGGIQNDVLKKTLELIGCTVTEIRGEAPCFEAGRDGTELYAEEGGGPRLSPEQTRALSAAIRARRIGGEPCAPLPDAIYAAALICAQMRRESSTLAELYARYVTPFKTVTRDVAVKNGRASVMAALSAMAVEAGADLSDGITFKSDRGAVSISPLRGKSAIRIRGKGANEEIAAELCAEFVSRVEAEDK